MPVLCRHGCSNSRACRRGLAWVPVTACELLGGRLRPFGYDTEILPGIRVSDASGHTPGHSAVLLESGGERLLCTGDLIHDPEEPRQAPASPQ